jgi:uncharacterized protein YejL (UPF0352 family)
MRISKSQMVEMCFHAVDKLNERLIEQPMELSLAVAGNINSALANVYNSELKTARRQSLERVVHS